MPSLRHFHAVFIVSAEGLLAFLAYWAMGRHLAGGGAGAVPIALSASVGFIVGAVYLRWFLKHE